MKRTYPSPYTPEKVMSAIHILSGQTSKGVSFFERKTREPIAVRSDFAKDNKTRLYITNGVYRPTKRISCTFRVTEQEDGSVIEVSARLFFWNDLIFYSILFGILIFCSIRLHKLFFLYLYIALIIITVTVGYVLRSRLLDRFFKDVIYQVDPGSKQMPPSSRSDLTEE